MKHFITGLLVFFLLAAACGDDDSESPNAAAVTFTGADGVESVIDDTGRVVSLNGDLTEILYELGLGDRVVGVDLTTDFPPEAANVPRVGLGQRLLAEPVLDVNPTVIIGDEQVGPQTTIDQLREAGVPVVILPSRTELDEMDDKVRDVATVMDVDGEALATRVQQEIDDARATATPLHMRASFVYVAGGGRTILLFGSGTPQHSLLDGAGVVDAGADSGLTGVVPLTPEAVVAAAPDVIVTTERAIEGVGGFDEFLAIPGIGESPAGRNRQILVYDDTFILGFGPRVGDALAQLIADLAALAA